MGKTYQWKYGDNGTQTYYETSIGKDYLCIYANKKSGNSNMYMGMYIKNGNTVNLWNKTYNDRMKKNGYCTKDGAPTKCMLLGSEDIEYMKRKLIYCYEHNKSEITP